jgi:hypothetical protein
MDGCKIKIDEILFRLKLFSAMGGGRDVEDFPVLSDGAPSAGDSGF